MYDIETIADAGQSPLTFPLHQGDVIDKGGPYMYFRRRLPGPGQEADAFMSVQQPQYSPIGPTYVNRRQVHNAVPVSLGHRTIGVQPLAVGQVNTADYVTQQLLTMQSGSFQG
jgi:hypothetical protein